jgi:mono/diheme cytochrome c family protein
MAVGQTAGPGSELPATTTYREFRTVGSKPRPSVAWTLLLIFAGAGLAGQAYAQAVPNTAAAGRALSEQYCVTCHVIDATNQKGWTDAPSFLAIANKPGTTAAGLSAIIQKPHVNMLNDQRPKPEADAMATYILSLRKR